MITFQISAKTYSGFQYKIPTEIANKMSEDEIITEVKIYMKNFFKIHNLWMLEEGVDKLQIHLHDKIPFTQETIYLCDHEH